MTAHTSFAPSASFTRESTNEFWSLWDGDGAGGGDGGGSGGGGGGDGCNSGACISDFNWTVLESWKQT